MGSWDPDRCENRRRIGNVSSSVFGIIRGCLFASVLIGNGISSVDLKSNCGRIINSLIA